jgi:hypothetical protein
LITFDVGGDHLAVANVGRQWHAADPAEDLQRFAQRLRPHGPHTSRHPGQQPQRHRLPNIPGDNDNRLAHLQPATGLAEHLPVAVLVGAEK